MLLLRPHDESSAHGVRVLKAVVEQHANRLVGHFTVVTEGGVRICPPMDYHNWGWSRPETIRYTAQAKPITVLPDIEPRGESKAPEAGLLVWSLGYVNALVKLWDEFRIVL